MIKNYKEYINESLLDKIEGPNIIEFHNSYLLNKLTLINYLYLCRKNKIKPLSKDIILKKEFNRTFDNTIDFFNFLMNDIKNLTPKGWKNLQVWGKNGIYMMYYDDNMERIHFNPYVMNILLDIFNSSCNELIKPINNFLKETENIDTNVRIDFNHLPMSWEYNKNVNESLLDKISGFSYDELKKNFLEGKLNAFKFYPIAKEQGEEKFVYDEVVRRLFTKGEHMWWYQYIDLCIDNGIEIDFNIIKKILFVGKIPLNKYYDLLNSFKNKTTPLTHDELVKYFNSDNEGLKEQLRFTIGETFNFCVTNKIQEGIDWFYNNGGSVIYNTFKEELKNLIKFNRKNDSVVYIKDDKDYFYYNINKREIGFNSSFIRLISSKVNNDGKLIHIRKNYYESIIKYFFSQEKDAYFQYTIHF